MYAISSREHLAAKQHFSCATLGGAANQLSTDITPDRSVGFFTSWLLVKLAILFCLKIGKPVHQHLLLGVCLAWACPTHADLAESCHPSVDRVMASANVVAHFSLEPARSKLLEVNSLQIRLACKGNGLLLHHWTVKLRALLNDIS